MPRITRSLRRLAGLTALAATLGGCVTTGQAPADTPLADAKTAITLGDHARAAVLLGPLAGGGGEAVVLLARARAGLARSLLARGPDDPAAQRAALDQVALALPLATADAGLREELLLAQGDLVALLAAEDERRASEHAAEQPAGPPAPAAPTASLPARPAASSPRPPALAAPTTTPAAIYGVARRVSFDGGGNSGEFASCIDVQILNAQGPVAGAVIGINNGDHSYQNQTDASGYAGRCGLGASTWSVVLFWTPAEGDVRGATTTVYVSGAPGQRAAVVFQGR